MGCGGKGRIGLSVGVRKMGLRGTRREGFGGWVDNDEDEEG